MKNADKPINPQIFSSTNNDNQLYEIWTDQDNQGLTKREHFAGLAMQGMISSTLNNSPKFIAEVAVKIADELLKQLDNKK